MASRSETARRVERRIVPVRGRVRCGVSILGRIGVANRGESNTGAEAARCDGGAKRLGVA